MADARRAARQRLESLQRAGVTNLPKSRGVKQVPAGDLAPPPPAKSQANSAPVSKKTECDAPTPPGKIVITDPPKSQADRVAMLDIVRTKVEACTRCHELCTTRTQTVFGVGNPIARLCFVGEAPGADEDKQGEPFVGRAGQLLNKIIEACTLKREDVYILNILRCRPPGNRPPAPDEAANCREYLEAQLAIIQPEFLCCLGTTAAQNLLATDLGISKLRGKLTPWNGKQVMCTYHPAYLLRNPAAKADVWADMKILMRAMGVELDKK